MALPISCGEPEAARPLHHSARRHHSRGCPSATWWLALLLQVVADYRRLNAALTAGYAGRGRASGPYYSGVADDCCCTGVTIRPSGLILTMDRGAKRRASRPLRSSRRTVGATVMGSVVCIYMPTVSIVIGRAASTRRRRAAPGESPLRGGPPATLAARYWRTTGAGNPE
jgi:hypothetical protein